MIPQVEDSRPGSRCARCEQALMRRVLLDAIRALDGPRPTAQVARAGIAARDPDEPFSFQNICEILDIEPDVLRATLLAPPYLQLQRASGGPGTRVLMLFLRSHLTTLVVTSSQGPGADAERDVACRSYDCAVRDTASNDLACQLTAEVADSFDYSFRLSVQP